LDFSHRDNRGKDIVLRRAVARGEIFLNPETIRAINDSQIAEGNVLTAARLAGINSARQTGLIIPFCHQDIPDQVDVSFEVRETRIIIKAVSVCAGRTGVEMGALSAVTGAALGIYDMCKAVDEYMLITNIALVEKTKNPPG